MPAEPHGIPTPKSECPSKKIENFNKNTYYSKTKETIWQNYFGQHGKFGIFTCLMTCRSTTYYDHVMV
jgi:hypothetical protein